MTESRAWSQLGDGMTYNYVTGVITGEMRVDQLAYSLAGLPRYNAWTRPYWSIASHACLVAEILAANADNPPSVILGGLHHDDHEALTGDILRPMMEALPEDAQQAVKLLQGKAQRAIVRQLGIFGLISDDSSWGARIGAADLAALEAERRVLYDVRMVWGTEKWVDTRMLEDGERIMRGDFARITFGAAAADRFVARHNTLLRMAVRS